MSTVISEENLPWTSPAATYQPPAKRRLSSAPAWRPSGERAMSGPARRRLRPARGRSRRQCRGADGAASATPSRRSASRTCYVGDESHTHVTLSGTSASSAPRWFRPGQPDGSGEAEDGSGPGPGRAARNASSLLLANEATTRRADPDQVARRAVSSASRSEASFRSAVGDELALSTRRRRRGGSRNGERREIDGVGSVPAQLRERPIPHVAPDRVNGSRPASRTRCADGGLKVTANPATRTAR